MEMVSAELETWNSTFLSGLQFLAKEIFCPKDFITAEFSGCCQDRMNLFCLLLSENLDFLRRFGCRALLSH